MGSSEAINATSEISYINVVGFLVDSSDTNSLPVFYCAHSDR